jgi:subtilisin family serine protease
MQHTFNLPLFSVEQTSLETINWGMICEGVRDLWNLTKGSNVKVAILDTGIAQRHHDLASAILQTKDTTNSRHGSDDVLGHGTHCAGIIAARNNGFGVLGVAPECKLLICKVISDNNSCNEQSVINGLNWAISQEADIISMSVGTKTSTEKLHNAIITASQKAYIVCAAGNNGKSLDAINYPARYIETISVGAIDHNRRIPVYSSQGDRVDIVAPGDQIISCWPPNGMAMLSGTSMACPFVVGIIALLVSYRKRNNKIKLTKEEILDILSKSAVDLGQTGKDVESGFGLIDPIALLRESEEHYSK